jgi:histidinol-phosphate phosphatase family protein
MSANGKPLLLLDRDGTLITEQDYLKDPRKVRFLRGSLEGLQRLARAGFKMVVVSNQSGVGRGLMTEKDVHRVTRRFKQLLRAKGVRMARIYWCSHHPDAGCDCRKPELGLVRKAARELGISLKGSISVGDKWSDVALGQKTGGKGILVRTGHGRDALREKHDKQADYIAPDFKAAANWILKSLERESPSWSKKRRKA